MNRNGNHSLRPLADPAPKPVLITGGAGFIGANLAHRILGSGRPVLLFDNLSREGVERNVRWLRETHGRNVAFLRGDIRDRDAVERAVEQAAQVFHFAAQVAVTTSLADARADFEVNALGTFNLLEALRRLEAPPPLLFTSTNKVYGALDDIPLHVHGQRYQPSDASVARHGIGERRPLDFHTPYGCSKGAAEQYVLDYARSFARPAAVFRMSCIYGPHQFGTEDQGWVAHFLIRALDGRPITIYGDGMQVRDILFVDDLVDALLLAQERMPALSGQAFNIGGGPERAVSLLELLSHIGRLGGSRVKLIHETPRTGDQRYYVSDTRKFQNAAGWSPRTGPLEGVECLYEWLSASRQPEPAGLAALPVQL